MALRVVLLGCRWGWARSLDPRFLYQTNAGYQLLEEEPYLFQGHKLPNPPRALPNEPDNTEISKEIYSSCSKSLIIKNFPKWVSHTGHKWDVLCEVSMSFSVCPLYKKPSQETVLSTGQSLGTGGWGRGCQPPSCHWGSLAPQANLIGKMQFF